MGTRGSYGFRVNDRDKLTYNHFDSYPSGLGNTIIAFIKETSDEELTDIANRLVLVDGESIPTPQQIEDLRQYFNGEVSTQNIDDWYCLLREAQGNPFEYKNGLNVMLEDSGFVLNSLFCEYAYIINVDKKVLEFYEGFNKNILAEGRYAIFSVGQRCSVDDYYGVALVYEFDFADIRKREVDSIVEEMELLNTW
jgi:hypothetical protein